MANQPGTSGKDVKNFVAGDDYDLGGGIDTVLLNFATDGDFTGSTLTSVEILKTAFAGGSTFTLDQADLAKSGSVIGSTGTDTIVINGAGLDLRSTTLSSIEVLRSGQDVATTFTVDQADLAKSGSVIGTAGKTDTLVIKGATLDLTSTTLTDIDVLQAGGVAATTFKVNQADLASGGSVVGGKGIDTLSTLDTEINLTSTTLTSIEKLTGTSTNTIFTLTGDNVDQLASGAGAAITGGKGTHDKLVVSSNANLSHVAVTGIEDYVAEGNLSFTFNQADLVVGGSISNVNSSNDVRINAAGTALDLTSMTLTDIDGLGSDLDATTWTVTSAELLGLAIVQGTGGTSSIDTLVVKGTDFDLTQTSISFVEVLKAGAKGTTFTVNGKDLDEITSIVGSSGTDTLATQNTSLDLTNIKLTSVEILKAASANPTTFTVDQADLLAGGSVIGSSSSDTLVVNSNTIDLSKTTLTDIETIETTLQANATKFTIGNGAGDATIDLSVNGKADTVVFTSAYKVTDVTDDTTILAHTLVIDDFKDGAGGDKLNLSAVTKGTPTSLGNDVIVAPSLKDAVDLEASGNGSSKAAVVIFQFSGDTYVLVDNSASNDMTANDALIKLNGIHALSGDNFVL